MNLPDLILKTAMVAGAVAFVAALRWARGRTASERTFRLAYHVMAVALGIASVILMVAILRHDFRFNYVVGYSSRDLPLLYLVSAFWAGQQGTLLLWALFAALLGYPLIRRRSWEPATVMSFYLPSIGFLFLLLLDAGGNPFRLASPVPADGRGLNPLLQDPWMASHPPVVFFGYAAMTVPAVLALAALIRRERDRWVAPALRWTLAAFVFLGAGIILGGFWAYKVLGWGGYWGWDPVENASLVPWIIVTALLHGLLVQRGTAGTFRRTNLILALAGYILVLYSTFLTRSGVLAEFSVHSFPQGTIYRLLVLILVMSIGTGIYLFLRHRGPAGPGISLTLSWPAVYGLMVGLLVVSALLVLLGTSWPILSTLAGAPAAVKPDFYNRSNQPLYFLLLGLLAAAPFLAWQARAGRFLAIRLLPAAAVATAATVAAHSFGARGTGPLLLFFVAVAAFVSNLIRFVVAARVAWLRTGAAIAHAGFALMFAGIIASSAWGGAEGVALPLAEPVRVFDRILTFQGQVRGSEPEVRWRIAVRRDGGAAEFVEPQMFRAAWGEKGQIIRRPGILRKVEGDLYIAPQEVSERLGRNARLELQREQSVPYEDSEITFLRFETDDGEEGNHQMIVHAHLQVRRGGMEETVALPMTVTAAGIEPGMMAIELLPGLLFSLERMMVEQDIVLVRVIDPAAPPVQILTVEVSTKPLIHLLWAGTILLLLGCTVAGVRRYREIAIVAAVTRGAIIVTRKAPKLVPAEKTS